MTPVNRSHRAACTRNPNDPAMETSQAMTEAVLHDALQTEDGAGSEREPGLPGSADTDPHEGTLPPMLREPSRLPGQVRKRFSPEQFFALSRVRRTDVDASDEGLWLTQEPCPLINPEGIRVDGELYWDPMLQPLVDVGSAARGRTFVIRYNRALFARGVLDEVIILEQDAAGGYTERCRCRPRHMASQVDLNRVLLERERLKRQLLAKVANAHEVRITLEQGTEALKELRDEQARQARIQRRTKHAPRAAAPINAKLDREARRAQEGAQVFDLNQRLQAATTPVASGAGDYTPVAAGQSATAPAPSATSPKAARRRRPTKDKPAKSVSAAPDSAGDPTGHERSGSPTLSSNEGDQSPSASPNAASRALIEHFGATTGFLGAEDD